VTKISKAKRAHLVMRCEVAASIVDGMRHLRRHKPWAVAPEGCTFELLTLNTPGGSFNMFQRTVALAQREIELTMLGVRL
jgi:hypothetical protein